MADVASREQVEVITVPFHGDEVLTVAVNGKPHIILKPVIEGLGLDYWAQVEKLRKRSWAALASRQVQVPDQGQRREMLTCDVQTFLMLLATVDENRVGKDVRPKLITYQAEVAQAIEAYWTKGSAVNPRAEQLSPARQLLQAVQLIVDHEERLAVQEQQVKEITARLDGIEQRTGWVTALGFARMRGLPTDHSSVLRLGKAAAQLCRQRNITPVKTNNAVYGEVNTYPETILAQAAGLVPA